MDNLEEKNVSEKPEKEEKEKKEHLIEFTVDGETYTTEEKRLTAEKIMQEAKVDQTQYYLVLMTDDGEKSFQQNPSEVIHMHPHMKFISIYTGPTTVSWRKR